MQTINLDYDKKYDILYARFPFSGHSYGTEDDDTGVITFHLIENDSITGIAVQDFKERFNSGALNLKLLPVPLDAIIAEIKKLIFS